MKFSLTLAILAASVAAVSAQSTDSVSTGEYTAPDAPSTCRPTDNTQTGDSCKQDGLKCGFDNMTRLCECNGSTWTCGGMVSLPTPVPAPTNSPKPTCDGTAAGCTIGGAYFTDSQGNPLKENEGTADVEGLDVGATAAEGSGAASKAASTMALGAAAVVAMAL